MTQFRRRLSALLLTALLAVTAGATAAAQTRADPEPASGWQAKPAATADRHMIVAAHPLAAAAGLGALRAGGTAADATVAALLVLNVVEPQSSGLGGGAFALVHSPGGLTSYDARETAPAAAGPDLFLERGEPLPFLDAVASGRSVGVPGLVHLLERLHARYGRLPWADLFRPAIRLAEQGFPVGSRLASLTETFAGRLGATDAAAVFLPGGQPLRSGETLRQPRLGRTLRLVAERRGEAFRGWPLGAEIVGATRNGPRPGTLTLVDLAAYGVIERPAVCHGFRGAWRVCGMGPPSSGATTVGQILGIVAAFPPQDDPAGAAHLFAEASRLAYADRARYLADPDHVEVPVRGLLDPGYLSGRARAIDPAAASAGPAEAGEPPWREGRRHAPDIGETRPGTTHLSVVDGEGLAIAVTASIESAFGSMRMAGGLLLNNQLTDFSFLPAAPDGTPVANAPAPGKRPRSSMAPTIVYRSGEPDRPTILAGSPGGSRIPEYVARTLIDMLDSGLGPAEAVARGHVSHRNRGEVTLEEGVHGTALAEGLRALGHEVGAAGMTSGLHVIRIGGKGLEGGADPRREGVAVGD